MTPATVHHGRAEAAPRRTRPRPGRRLRRAPPSASSAGHPRRPRSRPPPGSTSPTPTRPLTKSDAQTVSIDLTGSERSVIVVSLVLALCVERVGGLPVALSRWVGRTIGLDVHRDLCVVAICEDGRERVRGRLPSTPEGLKLLAESLVESDRVALEVTGSCWEVARILEPHVDRVSVVSLDDTVTTRARAKTTGWTRARWRGCVLGRAGGAVDARRSLPRAAPPARAARACSSTNARASRTRSTRSCSLACRANRDRLPAGAARAASELERPHACRARVRYRTLDRGPYS